MKNLNRLSRRSVLKGAVASVAGTGIFLSEQKQHAAHAASTGSNFVEAIVIGSGFGGSVAALRLGQAGFSTVVLERGLSWPITQQQNTFATYEQPDGRSAWLSPVTVDPINQNVPINVYTGVLDRVIGNGITVLSGVGVGGGSLVNNAALVQPTQSLFSRQFPALNYNQFNQTYYPRVLSILQPAPLPSDVLATSYYLSSQVFQQWAAAAGLSSNFGFINSAIDWNIVRQEIAGTKVPSAIAGEVWYGMNSGAHKSLDHNYLAQAQATGHVQILTLHVVTDITQTLLGYYNVTCQQIDTSGNVLSTTTFTCKYLFMAAGSMKTSELMVKAKAKGRLPLLNNQVGQGWGNNGDVVGFSFGFPSTNPGQGGPGSARITDFANSLGAVAVENGPFHGAPDGTLGTFAMAMPPSGAFPAKGVFQYNASTDSVTLTWPSSDPAITNLTAAITQTYSTLSVSMIPGAPPVGSSVQTGETVHPLGGMVLGQACDLSGEVYGYQNLYVVDSSLIPGSAGCANPSLTVAALAEYIMDQFTRCHDE